MADLTYYDDILASVRNDGVYRSIKQLVQPNHPLVKELAAILAESRDPVAAAQDFVHQFAPYAMEAGDYWAMPDETLQQENGDCDDLSILLCSILRNIYPADMVYCAFGTLDGGGHMWVIMEGEDGDDVIVEATASSTDKLHGDYRLMAMFNDQYALATPLGIRAYNLRVVQQQEGTASWQRKETNPAVV